MKSQDLKKSILQYAMQGKLVPQDPNDEPASELLKRIKAEKEQLIKEGKIKKEKPLPPITQDEIPYDLPQGWQWVRFQDITQVLTCGYASTPQYYENGRMFLSAKNVKPYKFLPQDHKFISEELYQTLIKNGKPELGDILLTRVGAGIGEAAIIDKDIDFAIYVSLTLIKLFKKEISPKYILHWLNSPFGVSKAINNTFGKGCSQGNLNVNQVRLFILPIPPLAEQKRIVEKLEEILPLVNEYGKNEEILSEMNQKLPKQIRQSILQYAVQGKLVEQNPQDEPASELLKRIKAEKDQLIKDGKIKKEKPLPPITQDEIPYDLPQGWQWCYLNNITTQIHYGYTASAIQSGDVKLVRITDIQDNQIKWDNVPYCDISEGNKNKYLLQNKDILIARTGGTIGKTYLVKNIMKQAVFASYLIRAIPSLHANSEYIKLFMDSPLYWEQLKNFSMGTGQPNVNGQSLNKLKIPLPPLAEQMRIVAKVEELMTLVNKLE